MAKEKGIKVPFTMQTTNADDTYPLVEDTLVEGGYRVVESMEDLYAIPFPRRKIGMMVFVENENKEYRLIQNPDQQDTTEADDWEEQLASSIELAEKTDIDGLFA